MSKDKSKTQRTETTETTGKGAAEGTKVVMVAKGNKVTNQSKDSQVIIEE